MSATVILDRLDVASASLRKENYSAARSSTLKHKKKNQKHKKHKKQQQHKQK